MNKCARFHETGCNGYRGDHDTYICDKPCRRWGGGWLHPEAHDEGAADDVS